MKRIPLILCLLFFVILLSSCVGTEEVFLVEEIRITGLTTMDMYNNPGSSLFVEVISDGEVDKSIDWFSSDETVASIELELIDDFGVYVFVVKAHKVGEVTLTFTSVFSPSISANVTTEVIDSTPTSEYFGHWRGIIHFSGYSGANDDLPLFGNIGLIEVEYDSDEDFGIWEVCLLSSPDTYIDITGECFNGITQGWDLIDMSGDRLIGYYDTTMCAGACIGILEFTYEQDSIDSYIEVYARASGYEGDNLTQRHPVVKFIDLFDDYLLLGVN